MSYLLVLILSAEAEAMLERAEAACERVHVPGKTQHLEQAGLGVPGIWNVIKYSGKQRVPGKKYLMCHRARGSECFPTCGLRLRGLCEPWALPPS